MPEPSQLEPTISQGPAAPPKPTDEERLAKAEQDKIIARDRLIPATLCEMLGGKPIGPLGAKMYVDGYLGECGNPTDPIERLLLQQFLLGHHRVAQLHLEASRAERAESAKILNAAAARLMAELRRLALAIRLYRSPVSAKSFAIVHQQNLVASGEQTVSYVDQSTQDEKKNSFACRDKLNGNRLQESMDDPEQSQESPTGGCRTAQRPQAATVGA